MASSPLPLVDDGLKLEQEMMANRRDHVDLGLTCADVCMALERGLSGKRLDELTNTVSEAIEQLTV